MGARRTEHSCAEVQRVHKVVRRLEPCPVLRSAQAPAVNERERTDDQCNRLHTIAWAGWNGEKPRRYRQAHCR